MEEIFETVELKAKDFPNHLRIKEIFPDFRSQAFFFQ